MSRNAIYGEVAVRRERERESLLSGCDLELRLGINGGRGTQAVFTRAQIQELSFQVTVFRYLRFGLPVPVELVVPIWNSVISSSKPGVQMHFPNLVAAFTSRFKIFARMTDDPEPERCMRNDGKKWRCPKSAILHYKYCEKHFHRGMSPRKPVEASQCALNPLVQAVSTSLDLMAPCCRSEKGGFGMLEDGSSSSYNGSGDWKRKYESIERDRNDGNRIGLAGNLACESKRKFNPFNITDANMINPGFDVYIDASSPRATVCTRLDLKRKIPEEKETEPKRCKRTDGNRWRCRRDVAPGKELCEVHVLRGRSKAKFKPNKVNATQVSTHDMNEPSKGENTHDLNIDLSISASNYGADER